MKYPRNVRIFRGQLDASPFVGVLFLMVIFLLLSSALVYPPGIPLDLPESEGWPGPTNPTVTVAVDGGGQLYYRNQVTTEMQLREQLGAAVAEQVPLTLVLLIDRSVPIETVVRLVTLGRGVGIEDWLVAVRPPAVLPAGAGAVFP
jgi:biopolymer transport protein ExbD